MTTDQSLIDALNQTIKAQSELIGYLKAEIERLKNTVHTTTSPQGVTFPYWQTQPSVGTWITTNPPTLSPLTTIGSGSITLTGDGKTTLQGIQGSTGPSCYTGTFGPRAETTGYISTAT